MSTHKARMAELTGGKVVEVSKILARSPADGGSGADHQRGSIESRPDLQADVGLG